jgi:tetratricopeptide (TPR) repeat protein
MDDSDAAPVNREELAYNESICPYPEHSPLNKLVVMELERSCLRLTIMLVGTLLLAGCTQSSKKDESASSGTKTATAAAKPRPDDHLTSARRMLQIGNLEAAAEIAYKALLQDPDNVDATLIASQVEAARGNHEVSAELAGSIDIRSRLGQKAVEIHCQQLMELNRTSEAADTLLAGLESMPDMTQWRHDAWRLLNQAGRREEASAQALSLCRSGLATQQELLSLISRTISFPSPGMLKASGSGDNVDRLFSSGLGKARWYFSLGEHRRALDELTAHYESGFRDVATDALYGRLLAETQQWDKFRVWSVNSSRQARQLGDFWAAIGTFFIDNQRYEAAARALLEAVRCNPTDRVCIQRLSKVLYAMSRADDGDQFRIRGVDIANTEREAQQLYASPEDIEIRKKLTRFVLELGRPFETLAWTLTILPANADGHRRAIAQQRTDLLQDPKANVMATESSLLDLDPAEFDLEPAWQELLTDGAPAKIRRVVASREVAATPRLVNRAEELGLVFQWYKDVEINLDSIPIHESLGGGIAVLDYDLDGWPDVYLAQGSGDPPTDQCTRSSQLFRHQAKLFRQVTPLASVGDYNYSSGLAAGDVNQDGFPDLYLGSLGHNRLLINNGDGTFHDQTSSLGEFPDQFTASVGVADITGDGLPDLFETNYIEMEGAFDLPRKGPDGRFVLPTPLSHFAASDRWFENLADGRFGMHEISRDVAKPGTSLGLVITDFGSDGKNEVFVGNDVRPNHFLVQSEGNLFVNLADSNGLANGFDGAANGCMGIATGDFNRDGTLDLQIANYSQEAANLYLQTSVGDFTDYSVRYGLDVPTRANVGFGTKAVDIDRNGFLDFLVTNGHIFDIRHAGEPYQMSPQLLMSDGQSFQLAAVDDDSGYWDQTYLGRTIATLDYDRDGALDFLVGHLDQPLALLHDETRTSGNWLQFELVGRESERDAIGAKLTLTVADSQFTEWVTAGDGYFCSDEPLVAFAFAELDPIGQLEVLWPSGIRQAFRAVKCGHRYLIIEGDPEVYERY